MAKSLPISVLPGVLRGLLTTSARHASLHSPGRIQSPPSSTRAQLNATLQNRSINAGETEGGHKTLNRQRLETREHNIIYHARTGHNRLPLTRTRRDESADPFHAEHTREADTQPKNLDHPNDARHRPPNAALHNPASSRHVDAIRNVPMRNPLPALMEHAPPPTRTPGTRPEPSSKPRNDRYSGMPSRSSP